MKFIKSAALFLLLSFGLACSGNFFDQTIDVDPPAYDKRMVMHALVSNQDSMLEFILTQNFGILESVPQSAWFVSGATLEWWMDGALKSVLPSTLDSDFLFRMPLLDLQAGHEYEIHISHPGFPTLIAKQTMPSVPQLDSARYKATVLSTNGQKLSGVDAYIQDQAGVRNYYEMKVYYEYYNLEPIFDPGGNFVGFDTLGLQEYTYSPYDSEDQNAKFGVDNSLLFSDDLFDGQSYKLSFLFDQYFGSGQDTRFRVTVRNITEDYYLYSYTAYRKYDVDGVPLVEPVTVHGNLENGIGIFGLANERSIWTE